MTVLTTEMSRTGCTDQSYSSNLVPQSVLDIRKGPAFLIYYGPAWLQNLHGDEPVKRLEVLAEVYRCARHLWPATHEAAGSTVIIRIDTIKNLSMTQLYAALEKN